MIEKALFWFGLGYMFMLIAAYLAYWQGYWKGYIKGREDAMNELIADMQATENKEGEEDEV